MPSTARADAARVPNPVRTRPRRERPRCTFRTRTSKFSLSIVPPLFLLKRGRNNLHAQGWEPFIPRCRTFLRGGRPARCRTPVPPSSVAASYRLPWYAPILRLGQRPHHPQRTHLARTSHTFPPRGRLSAPRSP